MVEPTKEQIELIKTVIEIAPQFEINFEREDFEKWKMLSNRFIVKGKYALLQWTLEDLAEAISNGQWEQELVKKDIVTQEKQQMREAMKLQNKELASKIKITNIAKDYGLKVVKGKSVCPFHGDNDPSLGFSDSKGVFNCFGCGEKGNIIMFIKKMEEIKNGDKRRNN